MPPSLSPGIAAEAARTITRAEAMGLLTADEDHTFSLALLRDALHGFAFAGIGRELFLSRQRVEPESLRVLNDIVEASPHPATEWSAAADVLGLELLGRLTGVSQSSIKRYAAGARPTPQAVALRLHVLVMIVADLLGAYTSYGVRRWFDRPRTKLDGRSPRQVLSGSWGPDDPDVARVRALADSLTSLGAA